MMMQNTIQHTLKQQPTLGTLAYWSVNSAPMFISNDRSSEGSGYAGVREGDGYA